MTTFPKSMSINGNVDSLRISGVSLKNKSMISKFSTHISLYSFEIMGNQCEQQTSIGHCKKKILWYAKWKSCKINEIVLLIW